MEGGEVLRHRLLVEVARLLPESVARLQCRARPHARGRHRRLLGNQNLIGIGVTGDGDTASIGIGQFMHMLRRNLPLIYVIENNGVYGLTKGQFSATADLGSKLKTGVPERYAAVRLLPGRHRAGRHVRRALVLRRQEATAGDSESGDRAQGSFASST